MFEAKSFKKGAKYHLIENYYILGIKAKFGISLTEFLDMPTEYHEYLEDICEVIQEAKESVKDENSSDVNQRMYPEDMEGLLDE